MSTEIIFFSAFIVFIVFVLLLDLLFIGRKSHEVSVREAAIWSAIWIILALSFSLFLRFFGEIVHGIENFEDLKIITQKYAPFLTLDDSSYENSLDLYRKNSAINFLSGYLIEKSLSVDNLFVMMAILTGFSVKKTDYKRVLFWGIMGAIVMRFIFIFAGAALIYKFEWLLYIFGLYLVYVGIKMYIQRNADTKIEPQNHPLVKYLSKRFRLYPRYVSDRFFIKKEGLIYITPLFIVLIIIEFTDLIFALDSIPAIFSVTRDPFIVFFSNIFAILGLRALFFLLVKVVEKFYLLKIGVSVLLVYVGLKLLLHEYLVHIGFKSSYSLYIILVVLSGSIILSIVFPKKSV
ncbi:MAG: TerC/Alx family metal homeostasis membrane protein [Bacteroidales bacterium]|nr:TerC/Alx family metal homeostasis membrane protein [Bacteroidales bacterium]MCF8391065.1 TerC/Alx family metal homeostasis membrane protein [Bacteroidales bacterium]